MNKIFFILFICILSINTLYSQTGKILIETELYKYGPDLHSNQFIVSVTQENGTFFGKNHKFPLINSGLEAVYFYDLYDYNLSQFPLTLGVSANYYVDPINLGYENCIEDINQMMHTPSNAYLTACNGISRFQLIDIPTQNIVSIGNCDVISIKKQVILSNIEYYWYYKKEGTNSEWTLFELNNHYNENGLNFTPNQIPDLLNYKGNLNIKFVIAHENLQTSKIDTYESNIVTYNIIDCSPRLDTNHPPIPKGETCYGKNDGEVIYTFDRPLETGERFLFTYNPIGAPTAITSAYSDDTNMVQKISSLEYKLIKITPRTYNFKYQTQFNNDNPSSPVVGPDFNITPKAALKFTVTPTQPSCSIGNGSVTIVANGGTAPYYYILDNAKENINGQVVPKKILITNPIQLPNGNHNIKVVDSNDCTQTQE
jgi:hypothetical protein